MLIFRLMEIAVPLFILLVAITQVIVPAYKGRLLFPFFRGRSKLEKEAAELNQRIDDEELRKANEVKKSNLEQEKEKMNDGSNSVK